MSQDWTEELASLAAYFKSRQIPQAVTLSGHEIITDVSKFITSHISYCYSNNGNSLYLPYLERLRKLKTIIK